MNIWRLYSKYYDKLLKLRPYRDMLEEVAVILLERQSDNKDAIILDAGCGTGNLSKLLLMEKGFKKIVAIDGSEDMLNIARIKLQLYLQTADNLRLVDLNRELPFLDDYFDVIISLNVLYAVSDPIMTLRQFCKKLKKGGRLILVNPRLNAFFGDAYREHCRLEKNIFKNISLFFNLLLVTLINIVLSIRMYNKKYSCYSQEEFKKILSELNFYNIKTKTTYANISILITAQK